MSEGLYYRFNVHILEKNVVEAITGVWELFDSRLRYGNSIVPSLCLILERSLDVEYDSVDVCF